jgi:hypothetical protein
VSFDLQILITPLVSSSDISDMIYNGNYPMHIPVRLLPIGLVVSESNFFH